MVGGTCFQFDVSHHAVMVLLVLEATLFFPIPQVPLFEVEIASYKFLSLDLYTKSICASTTLEQLPATVVYKSS